ncbi:DeoR/GlpR family DNA-binding transcription regulator [Streptomyces sp. NBC_01445]|uniref:DeoR/GlpR family DNA-binding transcription regulator n=1 Tax=Streptomyces sp. NBC_01445 TaxID=2903869 RepID=UPI002DDB6B33|nr:DeoR/GlpR family DNA-binding transcription regulator [Streptomyces sp. NBC_01445]WSE03675.1 DeoR/GlpR family DNA-binding transcription regulator [Streptomyces sp. NBC_01445]
MSGNGPLIPEQRHQELLRLLRGSGVLSIRELTARLNVSHMTVRRDIAALEESGQVVSVQGGVRLADWTGNAPPRERATRAALEVPRKQVIAQAAAGLVEDGTVVYLDAGTTCQEVVPLLAARTNLTVVTNDFHAALALMALPSVHTIHTGGEADADSGSSSGPLAARTIEDLNIDLAFLSTGTWDLSHGVTSHSSEKVLLKRAVMASAASVALLADSTKWGGVERFTVTRLDALDTVVTDSGLPAEIIDSIAEQGPKVLRTE